jgi:hypothetical protein
MRIYAAQLQADEDGGLEAELKARADRRRERETTVSTGLLSRERERLTRYRNRKFLPRLSSLCARSTAWTGAR